MLQKNRSWCKIYRVIYNAIEDITAAMKGLLDPVYEEKIIGHAEIRSTFKASGMVQSVVAMLLMVR